MNPSNGLVLPREMSTYSGADSREPRAEGKAFSSERGRPSRMASSILLCVLLFSLLVEADWSRAVRLPPWLQHSCGLPPPYVTRTARGISVGRSPDVTYIPKEPNFFGSFRGTTHSGPWDYLQEVPLLFYGPGFVPEAGHVATEGEITLANVVPTLAEHLAFPLPDGFRSPIREAVVPPTERNSRPRLVVVLVWDGGGMNLLSQWPDSWPALKTLSSEGAWIEGATVGSSPSVTPAVHATLGTGYFPRAHGIVSIRQRRGTVIAPAYEVDSPQHLERATLADLFDPNVRNRSRSGMIARENWHLGMIGHGAYRAGGDRDLVAFTRGDALSSNPKYYSIPPVLHDVHDAHWLAAHAERLQKLPELIRLRAARHEWQFRMVKRLVSVRAWGTDSVPDLLFTNWKEIDTFGHVKNMLHKDMADLLSFTDDILSRLVDFLDRRVGEGHWLLVLTADHGQTPRAGSTDAWPINATELKHDVAARFGESPSFIQHIRPNGVWLDHKTMRQRHILRSDVATFLVGYRLEDNVPPGRPIPARFRHRSRERLLAGAFPSGYVDRVLDCARDGRGSLLHASRHFL
jgi:hypothetical protein